MRNTLLSFLNIILLSYAGFCLLLYVGQRGFIYYPTEEVENVGAEAIWLASDDNKIKVWGISRDTDKAIIYFGGNAEQVALNIDTFSLVFPDRSIYLVNYRGYGGSTGSPTEEALLKDAQVVFDHVRNNHSKISLIGRSLGATVALSLAAKRDAQKVALVTPFDSAENVAFDAFPFVPVSLLLKDKYDSLQYAGDLKVPALVIMAEKDRIIPRKRSQGLIDALPAELTRVEVINGASHNSLDAYAAYLKTLSLFIDEEHQSTN